MPEVRIERAANKDLKRIGSERNRIVADLRQLAGDAPTLDLNAIAGT